MYLHALLARHKNLPTTPMKRSLGYLTKVLRLALGAALNFAELIAQA